MLDRATTCFLGAARLALGASAAAGVVAYGIDNSSACSSAGAAGWLTCANTSSVITVQLVRALQQVVMLPLDIHCGDAVNTSFGQRDDMSSLLTKFCWNGGKIFIHGRALYKL